MIDYEAMAPDYARHRGLHPGVLEGLLRAGGVGPSSTVLEVGCGTGNYIIAVRERAGCSCWGIDPSREMLSLAEGRSAAVGFQRGGAESIPFRDGFFDLVFSVDVIHHVTDRTAYFAEARRVLKAQGRICTGTDSEWIIRHRQPLATYFPQAVEADLERYPSIEELRHMMAQAGFDDIDEEMVEHRFELTDVQPFRDRVFSCLRLISEEAFHEGLARLERDLHAGPVRCASRYVLLWGASPRDG